MTARRFMALIAALMLGLSPVTAKAGERAYIEVLIQYYAQYYDVPLELVRRVVNRESTFNPRARNGPYWGLMQILPETARTMGYRGTPEGLLDPETNLIYAVKYLRGAYLVAGGNQDRAVQLYAQGYYYHARDMGLLEETGLRPGPKSPVAPTPPAQIAAAPPPPPQPLPQFTPAIVAAVAPAAPQALGFTPPPRPAEFIAAPSNNAALAAIEAAEQDPNGDALADLRLRMESVSAYFAAAVSGGGGTDIFEATFGLFEDAARSGTAPGEDGVTPPPHGF